MVERASKRRQAEPVAERGDSEDAVQLVRTSPRAVFAELMAGALQRLGVSPSPPAVAYVIGLLELNVRRPEVSSAERCGGSSLAEALLCAIDQVGPVQASRLRELGDTALFVSGFFGESLERHFAGPQHYREVGRTAYSQLSLQLARCAGEFPPSELFEELADEFGAFVDLLAEVGGRSRPDRSPKKADLLRIYDRYLETGSLKDRELLLREGVVPPPAEALRRWQ